jgi:mRNA interferase MazF
MQKDFDKWNIEKKLVNEKAINLDLFFHTREIWWCSSGLNIGVEVDGKNENFERPVLIIKKFNSHMIWVLPLTTKSKENKYYFRIKHNDIHSCIVLSQIKTISTKRLLRKIGTISENDFNEIISEIKNILTSDDNVEDRKPPYGGFLGGLSH